MPDPTPIVNSTAATQSWALAVYLLAVVGLCLFMVGAAYFLGGRARGPNKATPFESGVLGQGGARLRLSAKFYLMAMFFVLFDAEALFLYAWAVSAREAGWAGYIEALIFIIVLLAGLVYLWKLGALDWAPEGRRRLAKARN